MMMAHREPRLLDDGAAIEVELNGIPRRFRAMWLRDNAPDAATRSPGNGQRLITVLDLPANTRVSRAEWTATGIIVRFDPEGKSVTFDPRWLLDHAYDRLSVRAPGWTSDAITHWAADFGSRVETPDYATVRNDAARRRAWLKAIARYGIARLSGGTPEQIVALFGYVRETNYGRVFDVRVEANPDNLASTNLGLQAHTDNPYRDPVPGLQILCCLKNDAAGGESIVVDGFEVVRRLQQASPAGFALLTRYPARFDYAGAAGVRLSTKKPVIELGVDGQLLAIRFNNRSATALVDVPYQAMTDYYDANRHMAELIEAPELAIRFRLEPRDAFVVDNQRVLHARTAITGAGGRHLQGCHADRDGLLFICGRPFECKRYLEVLARGRMLPSVRPVMQR